MTSEFTHLPALFLPNIIFFFPFSFAEVWRSLPEAKYLWDYYSTAWNTLGQKTYPLSWQKQHPSRGTGEIPGLYVKGDWRRWGCTSMSSPLWPQGVIGWEQWLALFACATPPPPNSSTLPSLHLIPHPAEDRVNSCLRSLHLAETQYCAVLHFSRRPACERLNLQPLFHIWFITTRASLRRIKAVEETCCTAAGRYQSASVLILWALSPWAPLRSRVQMYSLGSV